MLSSPFGFVVPSVLFQISDVRTATRMQKEREIEKKRDQDRERQQGEARKEEKEQKQGTRRTSSGKNKKVTRVQKQETDDRYTPVVDNCSFV